MNGKCFLCTLTVFLAIVTGYAGATSLHAGEALAQYAFTSTGWTTFGIVLPKGHVTAGRLLAVGTFPTQTDVKNRWADGSIRYAILTAKITAAGTYDIREAEAAVSGSFTPVAPSAILDLTIEGTHYISTLAPSGTDVWLDGPLVREYRIRDIPHNGGAAHPFLSNIWDVRVYSDGSARVDVTVENIRDAAIADGVVYGVDVMLNGQRVFHRDAAVPGANPLTGWEDNKCTFKSENSGLQTGNYIRITSGDLAGEVAVVSVGANNFGSYPICFSGVQENAPWERVLYHPYATRWRRTFAANGFTEADITPDFAPFIAAGAVPAYLPTVNNPSRTVESEQREQGGRFDILNFGLMAMYMPTTGGREDIGPYPDWTAQYIVHRTDRQREYMLLNGDLAGSWSGHFAKNDPSEIVTVNEMPDYWLDTRAWGNNKPLNNLQGVANIPDGAHVPSLAYVPYLITGDRYYNDEMLHYANHAVLASNPGYNGRYGEQGLLWQNEMRGWAWRFRNITDAANYLPDNHKYKNYFTEIMKSNLRAMDAYSAANPSPLGFIPFNTNTSGELATSAFPWQYAYLAWSLDHAIRQNAGTDGSVMRDRILNLALTSLNSSPDFPREYAVMYWPAIGKREGEVINYFETWKEIFDANFRNADNSVNPPPAWEGGYGNEMHVLMVLAFQAGLPNAASALEWVDYEAGSGTMIASLNARAAYALLDVPPVRYDNKAELIYLSVNSISVAVADTMPYIAQCGDRSATLSLTATAALTVSVNGKQLDDLTDIPIEDDMTFTIQVVSEDGENKKYVLALYGVLNAQDVLFQRWDDVLAVNSNPANNDNHTDIDSVRWYRNDEYLFNTAWHIKLSDPVENYRAEISLDGKWHNVCGSPEIRTLEKVIAYPNPVSVGDNLNLHLPTYFAGGHVNVITLSGAMVKHKLPMPNINNVINVMDWSPGVYLLNIVSPTENVETVKIIVN
jgi:hypothetical protein